MDEITREPARLTVTDPEQLKGVEELSRFATANFSKLDKNHDMFISKEELEKAEASGEFKGRDAQYVKTLAQNVDKIADLYDDGWFTQSKGISPADLVQLGYTKQLRDEQVALAHRVGTFGLQNFDKLDFDKRGNVLGYELVSLSGEGQLGGKKAIFSGLSADDRQSLQHLRNHMDIIGHGEPVPQNVWIGKPWQYTTEFGISKNELVNYPQVVAHRNRFTLLNDIEKSLDEK